jgi:hypothetical protein
VRTARNSRCQPMSKPQHESALICFFHLAQSRFVIGVQQGEKMVDGLIGAEFGATLLGYAVLGAYLGLRPSDNK